MSERIFGSWPAFNGQKVVLDGDPRLRRGTAEVAVDFGRGPLEETLIVTAVAAEWVTADLPITVTPAGLPTTDHDPEDAAIEGVTAYAANRVPGVGFDVIATAPHGTWGTHLFHAVG